jgi:hypothetical protein
MTQPMERDPIRGVPGNSEFSWGPGLVPPGVARGLGQRRRQDDFGAILPGNQGQPQGDMDQWAQAVAERRTDVVDPESNIDMESLGNLDRYGANPPLVQAQPERNVSPYTTTEISKTPRGR